jgi:DNA-directed RNA polymerase specialized sigma24 family protein
VFDSADICQSVLAWFFLNDAAGRYDLSSPESLRRLFGVMVRNRVFYRARQAKAVHRARPLVGDVASRDDTPDAIAAENDLLAAVSRRFAAEEADLARRRYQGASWEEIAAAVGGTPDARRMQLSRATSRLVRELTAAE